jgi:hypothetical protein
MKIVKPRPMKMEGQIESGVRVHHCKVSDRKP